LALVHPDDAVRLRQLSAQMPSVLALGGLLLYDETIEATAGQAVPTNWAGRTSRGHAVV
jgi:hypothetical protein